MWYLTVAMLILWVICLSSHEILNCERRPVSVSLTTVTPVPGVEEPSESSDWVNRMATNITPKFMAKMKWNSETKGLAERLMRTFDEFFQSEHTHLSKNLLPQMEPLPWILTTWVSSASLKLMQTKHLASFTEKCEGLFENYSDCL